MFKKSESLTIELINTMKRVNKNSKSFKQTVNALKTVKLVNKSVDALTKHGSFLKNENHQKQTVTNINNTVKLKHKQCKLQQQQ